MTQKLIIIEDHEHVSQVLHQMGSNVGFAVDVYYSAELFLKSSQFVKGCVYIIDCNLPGMTGIELTKVIRFRDELATILMVSGNQDLETINLGLYSGADDYITKPFHTETLNRKLENAKRKIEGFKKIDLNQGFKLVPDSTLVMMNGKSSTLSVREFSILEILYNRKERNVPMSEISSILGPEISERCIESHISSMRKKLSPLFISIQSLRGHGYKLNFQ